MRIACLWVPELPLVAVLRAEPSLVSEKLAVVQPAPGDAKGVLVSRQRLVGAAGAEGVHAGQTLAEAQALCPELRVRLASPERVRAAARAAVDAAASVTPRLEEAAPGLVFLDVGGLESLIGDETAVARELLRASERVGLCAAVGLAEGKAAARLAARAAAVEARPRRTRAGVGGGALRVVPREEHRAFLQHLTLAQAEVSPELAAAAQRFGVATLGELARLPRRELSLRLGPEGVSLHRLAHGEDDSHLVARQLPEPFEEGEELDWSAASVEPLLFLWKALLDRLCARMAARGLAAAELCLLLRLAGGAWDERRIELAAPTREVGPLLTLLRLEVEARPPPEGVCAVRLSARPAREAPDQLGLFGPRTASPTQLSAAVARLAALVGPDRVGQPCAPDAHRPNAFAVERFAPPAAAALDGAPQAGMKGREAANEDPAQVALAVRALRPPRTAEVRCGDEGQPRLVIGEGALGGRVTASAGPWRTVAEWWTDSPVALDSWDLELAGGLLLRVSRELGSGAWWIEAVYD
jgi:protein ImuB